MISECGIDGEGRSWFKSDQYLTDITGAHDFFVKEVRVGFLWWKTTEYHLIGRWCVRRASWRYKYSQRGYEPAEYQKKLLGVYESEIQASAALCHIMEVRGIRPVEEHE